MARNDESPRTGRRDSGDDRTSTERLHSEEHRPSGDEVHEFSEEIPPGQGKGDGDEYDPGLLSSGKRKVKSRVEEDDRE